MLCVSNSHKHKEANLKKKSRIPLCALSVALLVSLYIFFRKRVNCSRPPNSLIWRKTRPIHVLVVICRNCRREKSPYPNGPTWVAPMFEGVQGQGDLQDHGIYICSDHNSNWPMEFIRRSTISHLVEQGTNSISQLANRLLQTEKLFFSYLWQDGDFSWTMTSRGHFFSKWVNSSGHFQRVNSCGHFWLNSRGHFLLSPSKIVH